MNKKVLSYALAAALMLPVSVASAKSMAMPLVQQTQASEDNTKGTQFFKGTFAQALAKAKQENKKLMVDCYTLWCGPCHYMATNVFPNDTLGKFMNEHFVCMKLDMEHGEGPERNKTFNVKAYPTFIFFDADGKEMNRFEGMAYQDEFQKRCERILKGEAPISEETKKEEAQQRKQKEKAAEKDTIIDEGKGVNFIKGSEVRFADVLAQAKRENKRVLVDFWATWCHACIQMNKTTLRDTRIGNLLNYTFVNYSVDMDHDPDGKELVEKYKIQAFPTYLILNPDGTVYNRVVGSNPVEPFAKALGVEIYDAEFKLGKEPALTVFIDKEGGVDLDTCEAFHRAIDEPLDNLDPTFGEPYTLNVSSPGLDRPLKTDKDFARAKGKKVEVKLFAPMKGKKFFETILEDFTETCVFLNTGKETEKIERAKIARINEAIDFD